MRIVCPNCQTAYDAPESVVAASRPMRCANCRVEWIPGGSPPLAPEPQAEPTLETEPERPQAEAHAAPTVPPSPRPEFVRAEAAPFAAPEPVILAPFPPPPAPPRPRRDVMIAWGASLAALVVIVWLAIAFRQPVMRHWPASQRAYMALGLG
jgi:predicted Zn finger-like uncharacterized protein